jgi:hypothetical protein
MLKKISLISCLVLMLSPGFAQLDDMEDINFPLNSSVVVDGFQSLDLIANVLQKYPNLSLEIVGHTDSIGSTGYNQRLSMKRAESVKAYLVGKGVAEAQLSTRGDGISRNYDNANREGRFQNRRVDLFLYEEVGGSKRKVSYPRLIELLAGGGDKAQMAAVVQESNGEVMAKLSDLEKQIKALEGRLDSAVAQAASSASKAVDQKMSSVSMSKNLGGYSGVSVAVGVDDESDFLGRAEGLYFKELSDNFGLQLQGEMLHRRFSNEAQFDGALVYQYNNFKTAFAGSYRYVSADNFESARLGQAALMGDYLFENGKIGAFATTPFADGDVIASGQPAGLSSAFVQETYVTVPEQYGLNFGVNIGERFNLAGFFAAVDTELDDAEDTAAGLDLSYQVKDNLKWYLDVQFNNHTMGNDADYQYTTGLTLGSWANMQYGRAAEGLTPVDIPRVRYEIQQRIERRGNNLPVVVLAPSQTNVAAGTVTLDASQSFDPDGDAVTFSWVQTEGEPVDLSSNSTAIVNFTGVAGNSYAFEVTVTDPLGSSALGRTRIVMEAAPPPEPDDAVITTFFISPATIDLGEFASLNWSTEYAETVMISGIGQVSASGTLLVSPDETTEYTLTATNPTSQATQTATLTVNQPVVVPDPEPSISFFNAAPATITEGEFTTLSWAAIDAETVTISGLGQVAAQGSLILSPDETTEYVLTATNPQGTATQAVTVTVEPIVITPNEAPIANAGPDQIFTSATRVTLDGSASSDPDGDPFTYQWIQTSGLPVQLDGATTANPTFTATQGEYSFRLVVTDDKGESDSDEVRVVIVSFKNGQNR